MRVSGLLLVLLSTLAGCADPPVGSESRPFTMYFVPSVDAAGLTQRSEQMREAVETYVSQKLYGVDEGFYVETAVPASYIAVVEALGTKKADFVAFSILAYYIAKYDKGYAVEPLFTIERNGGETTYRGQIIARADSGIHSLQDLAGVSFAYVDASSASGFILPSGMLNEQGVKLGEQIFAKKHDNVVTMVYQGQVDAGATYHSSPKRIKANDHFIEEIQDARRRVLTQFPDVEDKVRIVALTEEVPNEPWAIRSDLFEDPDLNARVKRYVREAIEQFVQTDEGKDALYTVATGTGLAPVDVPAYDRAAEMFRSSGVDVMKLLTAK